MKEKLNDTVEKILVKSEFTRKFIEHFGITPEQDIKLYWRENVWYRSHNKICRWEA